MLAIVRFNWPFYGVAVLVFGLCLFVGFFSDDWRIRAAALLAAAGPGYFLFVSLGVSHLIYDRSDLYRYTWLKRALGSPRGSRMVFCHSGFDEASAHLAEVIGNSEWMVLDHHDPVSMTEPSVSRARALFPPTPGTVAAPYDHWPVQDGWADVVFGMLAIHELRTVEERAKWFSEAGRTLTAGGRVVIVEHVRDAANFLAFGPGFLHFHSMENWRRSWEQAGLRLNDGFRISPWVRVFVIGKP
jgi:SAM-dependent methyltransferase